MAQEKSPNEKPRRPRKPKVMNDAPLVEQITELMMIHNKSDPKAGVQVVSEIDKDGKVKTVPADEKNENSFLKFDKNSSILENFIKNFWSQFKEPTHFRLLVHLVVVEGHAEQAEMGRFLELAPEILDEVFEYARVLVEFQE